MCSLAHCNTFLLMKHKASDIPLSFRPGHGLKKNLQLACRRTGKDRSEIINSILDLHLVNFAKTNPKTSRREQMRKLISESILTKGA